MIGKKGKTAYIQGVNELKVVTLGDDCINDLRQKVLNLCSKLLSYCAIRC